MKNYQDDLFETLADCFCPKKLAKPILVRDLFDQFKGCYSIRDISDSNELQVLYDYFKRQSSTNNGNYVHIPSNYLQRLIRVHMKYVFPPQKYQK